MITYRQGEYRDRCARKVGRQESVKSDIQTDRQEDNFTVITYIIFVPCRVTGVGVKY